MVGWANFGEQLLQKSILAIAPRNKRWGRISKVFIEKIYFIVRIIPLLALKCLHGRMNPTDPEQGAECHNPLENRGEADRPPHAL